MEIFNAMLTQMLMMFLFMVVGYFLRKKRIVPENADLAFSRVQYYIFLTATCTYSMMESCTVETFKENYNLILWGLGILVVMVILSYPLSKLFVRDHKESDAAEYKCDVYKYAIAFSNFIYIGSFLAQNLWGAKGLFEYTMFYLGINIICGTWGLYVLIPKNHNTSLIKNLIKGILVPPIIGMFIGMAMGLFDLVKYVPAFVMTSLSSASACLGPVAMLISGFVIAGYDLKGLFLKKDVYVLSVLRLLVLPALAILAVILLGGSTDIIKYSLIAFAAPVGMNTIVYPATFGGDPKPGASMVLISSILAIITMPIMFMIFNIPV